MRDRIRIFVVLLLVLVCFSFIYAIRNLEKADVSGLIGIESPFLASLAGTDDIDSLLKEQANSPFLQKTFGPVKRAIFDSVVPNIPGVPVSLSSLPDLRVIDLSDAYVVENVPFSTYLRSATSNFPPQISVLDWKKLEDHIIYGEEGTAVESQYLRFRDPNTIETGKIMFDSRDDVSADYFVVKKDEDIFEYEMKFGGGLRSKLDGKELIDLKEETLKIINREYSIYDTEVNFTRNEIKIDLLGGMKTYGLLTLEEGIPHLVKLPDREIIIVPKIYDNIGKVVFNVNGKDTKPLSDKEIDDIDGLRIGVVSILIDEAEEVRGGDLVLTRIADFQEGRFRLYDSNYADNNFTANGLEVDGENVLNSFVQIKAGVDTVRKDFVIDSIKYRLAPDSDLLVGANENMRNLLPQKSMFFDFLYLGGVGIAGGYAADLGGGLFGGVDFSEFLSLESTDSKTYRIKFTTKDNINYDFEFLNTSLRFGDDEGHKFITQESNGTQGFEFRLGDVILFNSKEDKTGQSHILRYDSYDYTGRTLYFKDIGDNSNKIVQMINISPSTLVCGDVTGDGRVTLLDNRTLYNVTNTSSFVGDGLTRCPFTGALSINGETCIGVVPSFYTNKCADSQGGAVGDAPNGVINLIDQDGLDDYLKTGGDKTLLASCASPCIDPRSAPTDPQQWLTGTLSYPGASYDIIKRHNTEDNLSIDFTGDNDFNRDNSSLVLSNGARVRFVRNGTKTLLNVIRQGDMFSMLRGQQDVNITFSYANSVLQTVVGNNKDINFTTIGTTYLIPGTTVTVKQSDKGAITSYGEFVVQNTLTTSSNKVFFFDKSGHYEFINGELVYVADDPSSSSVSDQGSGSLAIR